MTDAPLKKKFAVVKLWPDIKTAEDENIERLKIAARKIGAECVLIDKAGRFLEAPHAMVTKDDVDFVIHLHFETPKTYDVFSYVALWNPLQFYFDWGYRRFSLNLLTHDDYLSCSSPWADDHVRRLAGKDPYRDVSSFSSLYHSVVSPAQPPSLGQKKIIYCGINWEKILGKPGRFDLALKLLDKKGAVRIHGPRVFQGVKVWSDFKSYVGPIPFDGVSMVQAVREAGISLVLSSDAHKQSELMSNRLFEALAAGAAVICDENPFARRFFGDTLLYIDASGTAKEIADQVLEKHQWIVDHPEETLAMIARAQAIFNEKFTLDGSLRALYDGLPARKAVLTSLRFPRATQAPVTMFVVCHRFSMDDLRMQLNNVSSQDYPSCRPVFLFDEDEFRKKESDVAKEFARAKRPLSPVFFKSRNKDFSPSPGRARTIGEALVPLLQSLSEGDLFCLVAPNEMIFSDHVSSLVRCLEDHPESDTAVSDGILKHKNTKETFFDYDTKFSMSSASAIHSAVYLFKKTARTAETFAVMRYLNHRVPALLAGTSPDKGFPSTKRATVVQDIQHNFYYDGVHGEGVEGEIVRDYTGDYRRAASVAAGGDWFSLSHCSTVTKFDVLKDLIKSVPLPSAFFKPMRFIYRIIRKRIVTGGA